LTAPSEVRLRSGSTYVVDLIRAGVKGMRRTATGSERGSTLPRANRDLWERYLAAAARHHLTAERVADNSWVSSCRERARNFCGRSTNLPADPGFPPS
jgi:ribonuclease HI